MYGTAEVTSTTVTVAGDLDCNDLGVMRWGGENPMVHMQLGPVFCRIYKPDLTIEHVLSIWQSAAVHLARLPMRLGSEGLQRRPDGSLTTTVMSMTAFPACTAALVPGQTYQQPPHLVLRVGPVGWQVLDQAAYTSLMDVWERARDLVRPRH